MTRTHRPADAGVPLVSLHEASVTLGGAPVLRDLTLTLRRGDCWALLGGNGSGKSTLLRLLRGDQWLDPRHPGRRVFHGPGGEQSSPIGFRERTALVGGDDQDWYTRSDFELPVEAVIRSGIDGERYPVSPRDAARSARVARAAAAMGVAPLLRRSFATLSRGEGRKVLVARALAGRPAVLLLDEVCDGLDPEARDGLLRRLGAVAASGLTLVSATHRIEEIFAGVTRVLRLEAGRLVGDGPRDQPVRAAHGRPADGRISAGRTAAGRPAAGRHSDGRSAAGRTADGPRPGNPSFVLRDVTVVVDGRPVLDRIAWTVGAGEAWGVTGPNGAGKSTLLRLLAGEEQPARGTIHRLELGPSADATEVRARVGQVSPELQARHRLDARGVAVVLSGFLGTVGLATRPTALQRAAAAATLDRLGLSRLARRSFLSCSYGEQRLLLLARALAPAPQVLLLDEPFAGLDPGARGKLAEALSAERARGTTLVLVSHHEDELRGLVDRRARLVAGRLTR